MRYWTLPYDRQLTEWLTTVDPTRPAIMAGREFGSQPSLWQFERHALIAGAWLEANDLRWQPDPAIKTAAPSDWQNAIDNAWRTIHPEIRQLQMLMQDDRDRYLAEIEAQADGLPLYAIAFIGANHERYPSTIELINCGLAIGNVAYSYYKAKFKRVRPSVLCPGLVPAFGPPGHPSFPSGHSFLGHFIALLLLEIPALRQRYGLFDAAANDGRPGGKIDPRPPGRSVTIATANPAVVTLPSHGLEPHDPISFQTSGTLPAPIVAGHIYYVRNAGLTPDAFEISASLGGSAVSTGGSPQSGTHSLPRNPLAGTAEVSSPLIWFGGRQAKNRERLGVHYASDSSASRHLAAAIWRALLHDTGPTRIESPTLRSVLSRAVGEWPTKCP